MGKRTMPQQPDAPYFAQMAQYERGLLEFTLDSTDGDIDWAAQLLGITPEFLRERATSLGIDLPAPVAVETPPAPSVKPPKAKPEPVLKLVRPEEEEEADEGEADEEEEIDEEDDDVFEDEDEDDEDEDSDEEFEDDDDEDEEDAVLDDDDEPEEEEAPKTPGRKPVVSNDPNLLTRRDVELLLGLSTAAVLNMRTRGQLKAVWSDETKSYLFDREHTEQLAKERAEARARRRRAESEESGS